MIDDPPSGFNEHVAYSSASGCLEGRKLRSNSLHPLVRNVALREYQWEQSGRNKSAEVL